MEGDDGDGGFSHRAALQIADRCILEDAWRFALHKVSNNPTKMPVSNFGRPGAFALARNQAGGDWAAGVLLFRLKFRWKGERKLKRLGKDWIAMSRIDWAKEAGLSEAEMKNRALPKLRMRQFVTIRSMRLKGKNLLWMSLDEGLMLSDWTLDEETNGILLNGGAPPGFEKPPGNYPYKHSDEN